MDSLYHYCSTQSFVSIVRSRSIWLSSARLANDSMEGKIVNSVIAKLAEQDKLNPPTLSRLRSAVDFLEGMFDGLVFCLSKERDLLSQWRGYANDATGVAIGFSHSYLLTLSESTRGKNFPGFTLGEVRYSPEKHIQEVKPTYDEVLKLINDGAFKPTTLGLLMTTKNDEEFEKERKRIQKMDEAIYMHVISLFPRLFLLKGEAFKEEREWRLISYTFGADLDHCDYRARGDGIIPYRGFPLDLTKDSPLVEVVLGPKHPTPQKVVEEFLKSTGFGAVKVSRSAASYR